MTRCSCVFLLRVVVGFRAAVLARGAPGVLSRPCLGTPLERHDEEHFSGVCVPLKFSIFSRSGRPAPRRDQKQSPGAPALCAPPRAGLRRELDPDIAVREGRGAIEIRRA